MLSPEMAAELVYFCAMVFYGVVVSLCYHLLLFFRAVVRHSVSMTDAEDIMFFAAAGFAFFLVAYSKNYGILRWYAFAGACIGCLAYVRTLGDSLEGVRKWLLQKYPKAVRMKKKSNRKGQVPVDEGNSPEQKKKKEKRS